MRHGFLLIDKPLGPTSHDVVDRVRDLLKEPKIGHLGTLDPHASGLLVLAVGAKALKVIEFFTGLHKEYEATVHFGIVSTTYDAEGVLEEVKPRPGWISPEEIQMRNLIADRFTGHIAQTPPIYSAVKVNGQPAYKKARQGKEVRLAPREVEIESCDIIEYKYPQLRLHVKCSSGTYIRSLAHDLGDVLRCGSYLEGLRRTKVGEWSIGESCPPSDASWARVIPLKDVMKPFHGIDVSADEAEDIRCGRKIKHEVRPDTFAWFDGLPIAVLVPAKDGSRMAQPRKVL